MLSDFAKVFEKKVWRVQVAHLHNAARALSSPSRVFNCQQILAKISFVLFDIVIKKQIECGLAWHWWNSTDLGLIDRFLINLKAEIVACVLSFRKSRHKPNLENTSKYGFFPLIWGEKMAAFWACACKLSWTLLSPARVQPLYGAGRKESLGTGLKKTLLSLPSYADVLRLVTRRGRLNYLQSEKRYSKKKKTPFFYTLKGLSNKQQLFFTS